MDWFHKQDIQLPIFQTLVGVLACAVLWGLVAFIWQVVSQVRGWSRTFAYSPKFIRIAAKPTDAKAQFVAKYMMVPAASPNANGRTPVNCADERLHFLGNGFPCLLDLKVTNPRPTRAPHTMAAISDIAVSELFQQYARRLF